MRFNVICETRMKQMTTKISFACLILIGICSVPLSFAEAPRTTKIGVLLPLTGEFAAWGEGIRRAIQLVEDRFANLFAFQFEDEGNCEPQKSVAGFQKFITDGVQYAIVGCLAGTKAVLPIAKRHEILLLSVGLLDDNIFSQTSQLVNLATQLSTESRYLAAHVSSKGFKRPAIIHWDDPFSNEFASTLVSEFAMRGVTVVDHQAVNPKDMDYRTLLLRIAQQKPDAICFNMGQDQQGIILKQMRTLKIDVPVFTNYVFETPSALTLGILSNNVEYSFPLNSAELSPEKAQFDQEFQSRFGVAPTANSYFVCDGLVLLENAFKKCGPIDVSCVGDFFKSTTKFAGLSGAVSFHSNGSNDRPYGIKKVENGKFVWVSKVVELKISQIAKGSSRAQDAATS